MSSEYSPESDPDIPAYGWKARFDYEPPVKCKPFTLPRLKQVPDLLRLSVRYIFKFYLKKRFVEKKRPFIDGVSAHYWLPIYGVPLGGIGCGTIGRGYRGEFCRYNMVPGLYEQEIVYPNQFVVTIRKRGCVVYQQVLSHLSPSYEQVGDMYLWNWSFNKENARYVALYPRSWTIYDIPQQKIRLTCRQISPIIPHNYKDSSLPVGMFVWTIDNFNNEPVTVSITFTMRNGQGLKVEDELARDVVVESFENNEDDHLRGCLMHQKFRDMPCTYGIAARHSSQVNVSTLPGFNLFGASQSTPNMASANDVWSMLINNGALHSSSTSSQPSWRGEHIGMAVCAECKVAAHSKSEAEFVLVWQMPIIHFRSALHNYKKRYARWFPIEQHSGSIRLLQYGMKNYSSWEKQISDWQNPILNDNSLPAWYKSAIFNELYFVADGGTIWADPTTNLKFIESPSKVKKEIGFFGYLEGHEYRMYNTYDVHYYASWAIVELWPKIQLAMQYDVAQATVDEDHENVYYIHTGDTDKRSCVHSVPHDLGDPEDEPWEKVNSYIMYNTNEWKDLNPKFVLQVYRDWIVTGDRDYLHFMTPIVLDVMERSLRWDTDHDGIIDNGGYADQTYDAWKVTGASAYTGGLWIAALYATCKLARECKKDCKVFEELLEKASISYEKKLWNGIYYKYDNSNSSYSEAIMADQLNGHWYIKSCGLDEEVFPRDHVHSSLRTIYQNNVCGVGEGPMKGKIGAINGFLPDLKGKETSSVQSEEFWVGVNYALASTMVMEGMKEEGLAIAEGTYRTIYERYGLQFQTPEAYLDDGRFRSVGYMRPLCIWSLHRALTNKQRQTSPQFIATNNHHRLSESNGHIRN